MVQAADRNSSVFFPSPCFGVKFVNNYGHWGVAGLQDETDKGDLAIDIGRQVEWKKENKYRAKYKAVLEYCQRASLLDSCYSSH
jgi:hypothetical protein